MYHSLSKSKPFLCRISNPSPQVNATFSCTIRLNEEVYCIRDDGEWKDCPHGSSVNDLVLSVEKLVFRS